MKLPVISLAIIGTQAMVANASGGDLAGKLNAFQRLYTGVDFNTGAFVPQYLLFGYGPWIAKRFIGAIARPRVPIRGLPISFS